MFTSVPDIAAVNLLAANFGAFSNLSWYRLSPIFFFESCDFGKQAFQIRLNSGPKCSISRAFVDIALKPSIPILIFLQDRQNEDVILPD